jgi:hypothetical protein
MREKERLNEDWKEENKVRNKSTTYILEKENNTREINFYT